MNGRIILGDCMHLMQDTPDKFYDLAIVDPPYGIDNMLYRTSGNKMNELYKKNRWDIKPPDKYFTELLRVSKNTIIWGGNYFTENLPISRCWFFWNKLKFINCKQGDGELAWTSFDKNIREVRIRQTGFLREMTPIHPTQKPIALYKWLLKHNAKPGDTILDTHGGSMSLAIACEDMGFDYTITEIDKDYYDAGLKRLNQYLSAPKLFDVNK